MSAPYQRTAETQSFIDRVVAAARPATPEQLERLRALLPPPSPETVRAWLAEQGRGTQADAA